MRFFIAAMLYLVSLTMIVLGVAERTIWAPEPSREYVVLLDGKTPYVVLDTATLTKLEGKPTLKVTGGATNNVVVTGRESDILGWIGSDAYTRVTFDETGERLLFANVSGPVPGADPSVSDMWRTVKTDPTSVILRVDTENEAAVLISTDGTAAAPNAISLTWRVGFDLTSSNILIVGGVATMLAGVILNLFAYYSMRKKRGPRRRTPKAPQGPRYRPKRQNKVEKTRGRRSAKRFTAVAVTGLVLTSLSACTNPSAEPTPTPTESQLVQADPPVLDQEQIVKILADVVAAAAAGDEAKSIEPLRSRFAGPALTAREAHYKLQAKSRSIPKLPAISSDVISFQLPAASRVWPRTAMVVTNNEAGDQLPQVLVLQQTSPRENYKVWYNISVLPGAEFPSVPTVDIGSIPVAPDSLFLKVQPTQLPTVYGDLIDQGQASQYYGLFDLTKDAYYEQISKSQRDTIAKLTRATVTVTHTLGDPNVISLATVDSGALVAVYLNDTYKIKPKKKAAVTVDGNEKLLYGKQGSAKGIQSTYGDLLLFYVPSTSSNDLVQTLGANQFLLSVTTLK